MISESRFRGGARLGQRVSVCEPLSNVVKLTERSRLLRVMPGIALTKRYVVGCWPAWCQHADEQDHRQKGGTLLTLAPCTEQGKPDVASSARTRQARPQGRVMPRRVKDRGASECPAVMAGIGDARIAPTRKGADFHVVACRETGLLSNRPEGDVSSGVHRDPSGTGRA